MTVLNTTSDVNINMRGYYDRNLLENAWPELLHDRWAQIRPMPKNQGDRINFRIYGPLPVGSRLTEGKTPTGKKAQTSDIYTTLVQFGDFLTYSDRLVMLGLDSTLLEYGELLGQQAGDTVDQFHRDEMVSGTNVRYANGVAARTSVNTALSKNDLRSVVRTLEGNKTRKVKQMIAASTKVGTVPVRPSYIAITHFDCRQDLEDIPGFVPVEQYANHKSTYETELGEYKGIRFVATTNAKIHEDSGSGTLNGMVSTSSSQTDVYITMVFGANFYGSVPLQRKNIKNIIKDLGSSGVDDAIDQRGSSGWKTDIGGLILNNDFGVRLEHCVTDL